MANFEGRFGQGHRLWPEAAQPPVANNAAPLQQPPAPPAQAAPQAQEEIVWGRPAPANYHDTAARLEQAEMDRLAFQPGVTDPEKPRLAFGCEVLPDDTALPYDVLVERGQAPPRAGAAEPAPAAVPAAVPGTEPAQNNALAQAAPQARSGVNANALALRDPFPTLHELQQRDRRINATVNVDPFPTLHELQQRDRRLNATVDAGPFQANISQGMYRPFGPLPINNNMNNMTNMYPFGPYPSAGIIPVSTAWLDNDAEAKELFATFTKLLEQERAKHGFHQDWVAKCQRSIHRKANSYGTAAAKEIMRNAPQRLERWNQWMTSMGGVEAVNAMSPFGGSGGMGGMGPGGYGMGVWPGGGYGGGYGGMW